MYVQTIVVLTRKIAGTGYPNQQYMNYILSTKKLTRDTTTKTIPPKRLMSNNPDVTSWKVIDVLPSKTRCYIILLLLLRIYMQVIFKPALYFRALAIKLFKCT